MPELPLIIAAAVAVFVSGTVYGVTGFGFVIVAAPILTIFLEPSLVVPVLVLQGVVLGVLLMSATYRWFTPKRVWLLMLSGVAGTPLGTFLLVNLDPGAVKVLLGAVVGITAVAMLLGLQRAARNEQLASVPVGLASGVLIGSTGLAGAPVILFFANQGIEPQRFRANIVFYLQVVGLLAMPSFFVGGLLTADAGRLTGALLPASVAGALFGMWLSPRVSAALFRRLALMVVLAAAGGSIVAGVVGS